MMKLILLSFLLFVLVVICEDHHHHHYHHHQYDDESSSDSDDEDDSSDRVHTLNVVVGGRERHELIELLNEFFTDLLDSRLALGDRRLPPLANLRFSVGSVETIVHDLFWETAKVKSVDTSVGDRANGQVVRASGHVLIDFIGLGSSVTVGGEAHNLVFAAGPLTASIGFGFVDLLPGCGADTGRQLKTQIRSAAVHDVALVVDGLDPFSQSAVGLVFGAGKQVLVGLLNQVLQDPDTATLTVTVPLDHDICALLPPPRPFDQSGLTDKRQVTVETAPEKQPLPADLVHLNLVPRAIVDAADTAEDDVVMEKWTAFLQAAFKNITTDTDPSFDWFECTESTWSNAVFCDDGVRGFSIVALDCSGCSLQCAKEICDDLCSYTWRDYFNPACGGCEAAEKLCESHGTCDDGCDALGDVVSTKVGAELVIDGVQQLASLQITSASQVSGQQWIQFSGSSGVYVTASGHYLPDEHHTFSVGALVPDAVNISGTMQYTCDPITKLVVLSATMQSVSFQFDQDAILDRIFSFNTVSSAFEWVRSKSGESGAKTDDSVTNSIKAGFNVVQTKINSYLLPAFNSYFKQNIPLEFPAQVYCESILL